MTDLYARNGFLIRHRELAEGVSELELKFPMSKNEDAIVYGLALADLALRQRGVPFVACSPTLLSLAVRTADLDEATRAAFVAAVEHVQRHVTRLFADAEIYLFNRSDKGVVETDPEGLLAAYKQGDFIGKRFLERFAAG
jgi:hypothetical protein